MFFRRFSICCTHVCSEISLRNGSISIYTKQKHATSLLLPSLPVVALLAREALEVVDVGARPHHHLEGRDHLLARRAVTRRPEQPAAATEFLVKRTNTNLPKSHITNSSTSNWTSAFEHSQLKQLSGEHTGKRGELEKAAPGEDRQPCWTGLQRNRFGMSPAVFHRYRKVLTALWRTRRRVILGFKKRFQRTRRSALPRSVHFWHSPHVGIRELWRPI